jgi:hypothetical protein
LTRINVPGTLLRDINRAASSDREKPENAEGAEERQAAEGTDDECGTGTLMSGTMTLMTEPAGRCE